MKSFFSIITSVFLFLGITPIALAANGPALNADRASTEYTASALTKCSDNPKFIERANYEISASNEFDFALTNQNVDETVKKIIKLIKT